jgi:hypothetical protein
MELLASRSEFERADAIQGVAELSVFLSGSVESTVEKVRQASPELIKKLGSKVHEVLLLLNELPALETTVETIEPLAPEPVIVEQPVMAIEETKQEAPDELLAGNPLLSKKGLRWLERCFGEQWADKLGLSLTDGSDVVTARILELTNPRNSSTAQKSRTRIKGLLDGLSTAEISALSPGDNVAATSMHFSNLAKKFKSLETIPHSRSHGSSSVSGMFSQELASGERSPRSAVRTLEHRLDDEPQHIHLSIIIAEQLQLSGMQKFALQSFLDPKSRSDMTSAKIEAVQQIRDAIRDKINSPAIDLSAAEKQWIRRSFGVYVFQGDPQDREPVSIFELRAAVQKPGQKDDIPGLIYDGLDKLFTTDESRVYSVDRYTQAALNPEAVSADEFDILHAELIAELAETNTFSADQLEAFAKRSRYGRNGGHQEVSEALKGALRQIEQQLIQRGGVNSGNDLIDSTVKKFLQPNRMLSHLDAIKAELPLDMQQDPTVVERMIVAGIHSLYEQEKQKAA